MTLVLKERFSITEFGDVAVSLWVSLNRPNKHKNGIIASAWVNLVFVNIMLVNAIKAYI